MVCMEVDGEAGSVLERGEADREFEADVAAMFGACLSRKEVVCSTRKGTTAVGVDAVSRYSLLWGCKCMSTFMLSGNGWVGGDCDGKDEFTGRDGG